MANIDEAYEVTRNVDTSSGIQDAYRVASVVHGMFYTDDWFAWHYRALGLVVTMWCSTFNELCARLEDTTGCHKLERREATAYVMMLAHDPKTGVFGRVNLDAILGSLDMSYEVLPTSSSQIRSSVEWCFKLPQVNAIVVSPEHLRYPVPSAPGMSMWLDRHVALKIVDAYGLHYDRGGECVMFDPILRAFYGVAIREGFPEACRSGCYVSLCPLELIPTR